MANRDDFRKSARNRLNVAILLANDQCRYPVEVSYFCTVAIECVLKRKLMSIHGFRRTEQITDDKHQAFELFKGKTGHDLERLRHSVGEKISSSRAWTRIKNPIGPILFATIGFDELYFQMPL